MKAETGKLLGIQDPVIGSDSAKNGWRVVLPLTIVTLAIILLVHWRTVESIVAIWSRSETFQHGFLVVPISAFLVWTRRREVAKLAPSPDILGLLLLAGAGLVWLVGSVGQIQVGTQYALVAMIPATVVAIAGRQVARALTFPLAFLLFGVPVGEALIAPLMYWTADFTVAALRLTGIPVYREGTFFVIPSGSWSVVEGCSGVRYLIASITVGTLYAYLTYRRLWRRVLFIALSAVVPIIANWLRAYMIVMIAHLSDMKFAHGVDHLIYGWIFFGVVMLLLFWLGSIWRDHASSLADSKVETLPDVAAVARIGFWGQAARAIAAVAVAGGWPLYAAHLEGTINRSPTPVLTFPVGTSAWSAEAMPLTDWRPRYNGSAASLFHVYRNGDHAVALYLGYYRNQRQGAELVTSTNIMVQQKHPVWGNVWESYRREDLGNGPVRIRETQLRSPAQRLLVWDWFRMSERDLSSPYLAKLLLTRDRLLGLGDDAAAIILATPYEERPEIARETLRRFVRDMLPSIDATLAQAAATANSAR